MHHMLVLMLLQTFSFLFVFFFVILLPMHQSAVMLAVSGAHSLRLLFSFCLFSHRELFCNESVFFFRRFFLRHITFPTYECVRVPTESVAESHISFSWMNSHDTLLVCITHISLAAWWKVNRCEHKQQNKQSVVTKLELVWVWVWVCVLYSWKNWGNEKEKKRHETNFKIIIV